MFPFFFNQLKNSAVPTAIYIMKWLLFAIIIGFLAGSASALFLVTLDWVGNFRESQRWLILLLPAGGLLVGTIYYFFGKGIESGNTLLIEKIHTPASEHIPAKMAPMILIGTLLTHLFGGSAGREGTAIQMSGALADQLSRFIKITSKDRTTLLIAAISAGFASIFGTPLAGTIFGLEIYLIGKIRYHALLPALFAAVLADYTTQSIWHVHHTVYSIPFVPSLTISSILFAVLAGACFGLTALFFIRSSHALTDVIKNRITYSWLRPLIGGILLLAGFYFVYMLLDSTKFIGLGVPYIVEAFTEPSTPYDFLLKILFTVVTLSFGFKGGEVTPLFFIGASLGSALSIILPIPTALLAGMGFAAVFAGATNTPLACIFMAMELFGSSSAVYVGIACIVSYLCSGQAGIYRTAYDAEETEYL
jgi:H+/Cl- antiporter ClcA